MNRRMLDDPKLEEIANDSAFAGSGRSLMPVPPRMWIWMKNMRLSAVARMYGAKESTSVLEGLCYARSHSRCWQLYRDSEIAADPGKRQAWLYAFTSNVQSPFVLILAGGGYMMTTTLTAAFPVAMALNQMKINAYVLHYRSGQSKAPEKAYEDLQRELDLIFLKEKENTVLKKYALCGLSAGGHLAIRLGCETKLEVEKRPGVLFLAYPMVDFRGKRGQTLALRLHVDRKSHALLSYIDNKFPPTYLWQCADDRVLSPTHALDLHKKLSENGVTHIYRQFPSGGHGQHLGEGTSAAGWLYEAVDFWQAFSSEQPGIPDVARRKKQNDALRKVDELF